MHSSLVTKNPMQIICSNTTFILTFETKKVSSTRILLESELNVAPSFLSNHKKLYYYILFLLDFMRPKMRA